MVPPPRKVLFVEDEAALQYSYERFFEGKYTMAYAPNGAEAMRQLNNFEPDVLVLDMRLPDTDGIALLQRIRETRPALPDALQQCDPVGVGRSEEHTSELQSQSNLVCRLLLEKKKKHN